MEKNPLPHGEAFIITQGERERKGGRGGCNGLETRERRLYGKRTETRRGRKGDS